MLKEPSQVEIDRYHYVMRFVARFQKTAAPLAFKWIEWSAVLSLLIFVERRTQAWPITGLIWILALLLWGYFIHFFSGSYKWVPYKEAFSKRRNFDWLLALAATAAILAASFWFADLLSRHPF
ncbi:hypothetical protein [Arenimonas sp.]|uniref:hypothetical protein n=1 Tax=Arenimonas sp. TaxID=1872635 RepID=UPI002E33E395|nr:hypothetical protein [Arenimonas sp.]HEX4852749.1 hypothetical protein [Arenimonas sp.]